MIIFWAMPVFALLCKRSYGTRLSTACSIGLGFKPGPMEQAITIPCPAPPYAELRPHGLRGNSCFVFLLSGEFMNLPFPSISLSGLKKLGAFGGLKNTREGG
jgi:hypothetical protein